MTQNFIIKLKSGVTIRKNDSYENILNKFGKNLLWVDVVEGINVKGY